jgi:hypothetical protein
LNIFIVGVQKCGTTSLASALGQLPGFELATPKEPMLLSRGAPEHHRSMPLVESCKFHNMTDNELLDEYEKCFQKDSPHKIDASTSYFTSDLALKRIKRLFPQARILILIRHPVKRLNSAYWHYVRSGMALRKLKRELEFGPDNLLGFSCYNQSIEKWKLNFGQQVHVACTEQIWEQPEAYLKSVSRVLDVDYSSIPAHIKDFLLVKENSANVPISHGAQLIINYMKQRSDLNFSQADLKRRGLYKNYGAAGGVLHALTKLNLRKKKYPMVNEELSYILTQYLKEMNSDIHKVVDYGSPSSWWDEADK